MDGRFVPGRFVGVPKFSCWEIKIFFFKGFAYWTTNFPPGSLLSVVSSLCPIEKIKRFSALKTSDILLLEK